MDDKPNPFLDTAVADKPNPFDDGKKNFGREQNPEPSSSFSEAVGQNTPNSDASSTLKPIDEHLLSTVKDQLVNNPLFNSSNPNSEKNKDAFINHFKGTPNENYVTAVANEVDANKKKLVDNSAILNLNNQGKLTTTDFHTGKQTTSKQPLVSGVSNVTASINAGDALLALNKPDDAINMYNNAIAHAQKNSEQTYLQGAPQEQKTEENVTAKALYGIGNALAKQGKVNESIDIYNQALQNIQPTEKSDELKADINQSLAISKYKTGDKVGSAQHIQQAKDLQSGFQGFPNKSPDAKLAEQQQELKSLGAPTTLGEQAEAEAQDLIEKQKRADYIGSIATGLEKPLKYAMSYPEATANAIVNGTKTLGEGLSDIGASSGSDNYGLLGKGVLKSVGGLVDIAFNVIPAAVAFNAGTKLIKDTAEEVTGKEDNPISQLMDIPFQFGTIASKSIFDYEPKADDKSGAAALVHFVDTAVSFATMHAVMGGAEKAKEYAKENFPLFANVKNIQDLQDISKKIAEGGKPEEIQQAQKYVDYLKSLKLDNVAVALKKQDTPIANKVVESIDNKKEDLKSAETENDSPELTALKQKQEALINAKNIPAILQPKIQQDLIDVSKQIELQKQKENSDSVQGGLDKAQTNEDVENQKQIEQFKVDNPELANIIPQLQPEGEGSPVVGNKEKEGETERIKPKSKLIETTSDYRTADVGNHEGQQEFETVPQDGSKIDKSKGNQTELKKQQTENILNGNVKLDADANGEGGKGETGKQAFGRIISRFIKDKETQPDGTAIVAHSSVLKAIKTYEELKDSPNFKGADWSKLTEAQYKEFAEKYIKQSTENGDIETFDSKNGKIHVVRHGQTEDNLTGKFRDDNTQLTDKGRKQAKEAGQQLSKDTPKIISSDFDRAVETSNIISDEIGKEKPKVEEKPIDKVEPTQEQIDHSYEQRAHELSDLRKSNPKSYKQQIINDNIGRVKRSDVEHYNDKNNLANKEDLSTWQGENLNMFSKDALPLDTQAQQLSEIAGVEITPNDIADYIIDRKNNPEKYHKEEVKKYKQAEQVPIDVAEVIAKYSDEHDMANPDVVESLRHFPLSEEETNAIKEYIKNGNKPTEVSNTETSKSTKRSNETKGRSNEVERGTTKSESRKTEKGSTKEDVKEVPLTKKELAQKKIDNILYKRSIAKEQQKLKNESGIGEKKQGYLSDEDLSDLMEIAKQHLIILGENTKDTVSKAIEHAKSLLGINELSEEDYKNINDILNKESVSDKLHSAKNKVIEAKREALGQEPIFKELKQNDVSLFNEVERITSEEGAVDTLVDSAEKRKYAFNAAEQLSILRERSVKDEKLGELDAKVIEGDTSNEILLKRAELRSQLDRYDQVLANIGTVSGQVLRARRFFIDKELNLKSILDRMKADSQGRDIPKETQDLIESLFKDREDRIKKVSDLQDEYDQAKSDLAIAKTHIEEIESAKAEISPSRRGVKQSPESRVKDLKKVYEDRLSKRDKLAEAKADSAKRLEDAKAKFRKASAGSLSSGGFHALPEFIELVKAYIADKVLTAKEFIAKFKEDFPDVKLDEKEASKKFEEQVANSKNLNDEDLIRAIGREIIKDSVANGEKLTHEQWRDRVHEQLGEINPDLSKREVQDILSGYGKEVKPKTDEVSKTLSKLKSLLRITSGIEDVREGELPKKSGFNRGEQSPEARILRQELSKAIKEEGLDVSVNDDPKKWKSAIERVKTSLRNSIDLLDKQIAEKKRIGSEKKSALVLDAEALDLKAQKEAKQATLDKVLEKEGVIDKEVLNSNKKQLQKKIAELDDAIKTEKDLKKTSKGKGKLSDAEYEELKSKKQELQDTYDKWYNEKFEEDIKVKKLSTALQKVTDRIEKKQKLVEQAKTKKEYEGLLAKKRANPDYSKASDRVQELANKLDKAKIEEQKVNSKIKNERENWRLLNRTKTERAFDLINDITREGAISAPSALPKIFSSGVINQLIEPISNTVGLSTRYFVPKEVNDAVKTEFKYDDSKSLKQNSKDFLNVEVHALGRYFKADTWKEAWGKFETGKHSEDVKFSKDEHKRYNIPIKINGKTYNFNPMIFGAAHGFLKTPSYKVAFDRALQYLSLDAIKDAKNFDESTGELKDDVVNSIKQQAYEEALHHVFLQENAIAKTVRALPRFIDTTLSKTANTEWLRKIVNPLLKLNMQVLNVGLNFASKQMSYIPAYAHAKAYLPLIIRKISGETKTLTQSEGKYIKRNITSGNVGIGLMALGYFAPNIFDDDGDMQVNGKKLPHWLAHVPVLFVVKLGSMLRKHVDNGEEDGKKTFALKAISEMAKANPFNYTSRAVSTSIESNNKASQFAFDQSLGRFIPQFLREIAKEQDEEGTKYDPQNWWDRAKLDIPYARQTVDEK